MLLYHILLPSLVSAPPAFTIRVPSLTPSLYLQPEIEMPPLIICSIGVPEGLWILSAVIMAGFVRCEPTVTGNLKLRGVSRVTQRRD